MQPGPPPSLQMPSFFHGSFMTVARKTNKEGHRCGEQYRKDGTFPAPRELLEIPPGTVVLTHEVADFQHERPAWRLYLISRVMGGLYEAMDYQNTLQVRDAYEVFCRETAWGALHFAIEPTGPVSASRTALRLQAALRFWEPLQSARYLFKTFNQVLSLDELLTASCDWAMDAWCPVGESGVHARLEKAAERMAQATPEDMMEAILRQMPRAFEHARNLKHRSALADPSLLRKRLKMLSPDAFEHVSGACTSDLLGQLYAWDREMEKQ
jgi:hypothetical protein